jgi:hypothetical protein
MAIDRWMDASDLPFPRPGAAEWREVEDQLAAGYPPELGRLLDRMLGAGMSRTVAVWGLASVAGSRLFAQLNRKARRATGMRLPGLDRLLDEVDFSILPAAFEAGRKDFAPAHAAVIDHYSRHYAPPVAMTAAEAAGYCFGHAAAPGPVRTVNAFEAAVLGGELSEETPVYLPVSGCLGVLHETILDSLFGQADPIPAAFRPPDEPEDCFEHPFADWCRGLLRALDTRADDWRAHLESHPRLQADRECTVDTLTLFAARSRAADIVTRRATAEERPTETLARLHRRIDTATGHLYRLAHPVLLD